MCTTCRSPFFIEVEDPTRDLIDPAVKGTENVLKSVIKHRNTVQRTVVTSSVAGPYLWECTIEHVVLLTNGYRSYLLAVHSCAGQ